MDYSVRINIIEKEMLIKGDFTLGLIWVDGVAEDGGLTSEKWFKIRLSGYRVWNALIYMCTAEPRYALMHMYIKYESEII